MESSVIETEAGYQYILRLTPGEVAILRNDLLDVKAWLDGDVAGKLSRCTKRIVQAELERAVKEDVTITGKPSDIALAFVRRPDHMGRKEREEAATKERKERLKRERPKNGNAEASI